MPINSFEERISDRLSDLAKRFDAFTTLDRPGSQLYTATHIPFAGASGSLGSSANLTYDGTDLEVKMTGLYPAVNIQEASTSNRRATIGFGLNTPTATTGYTLGQSLNNNTVKDFFLYDNTAGAVRLYIDTSGRVTIGPNGATRKLTVDDTTTAYQSFNIAGVEKFVIGAESNRFLVFDTAAGAYRFEINTSGQVGIGIAPSHKLHISDAASASIEAAVTNTNGFARIRFATNSRIWGFVTEGSTGFTFPGELALYDYTASAQRLRFTSADNYYYGTNHTFYTSGNARWVINGSGDLLPLTAGTLNLGNAVAYMNDVSYKTLTDRGCIAVVPFWDTLDGKRVTNLDAIRAMRAHPTEKTIYGEVKLDYASVPKHAHKPAQIATDDIELDIVDANGKPKKYKKGEKIGEDGVEMTSIFSMMLGAIRELAVEVDSLKGAKNDNAHK